MKCLLSSSAVVSGLEILTRNRLHGRGVVGHVIEEEMRDWHEHRSVDAFVGLFLGRFCCAPLPSRSRRVGVRSFPSRRTLSGVTSIRSHCVPSPPLGYSVT